MTEFVQSPGRTLVINRTVPFSAMIVETKTGSLLLKALTSVAKECDPSSQVEARTLRMACRKLKSPSLCG